MEMEWIPRSLNEKSDLLSHVIDHGDRAISDHIFYRLEHLWGPHSIDRFADHLNCKLLRFNSKYWVPGSENVDCFACDWKHDNNYACPPVSLISRTIFHMRNCRATGTMILPVWHSAPFWPLIYSFKEKTFERFITEFMEIPNKKNSFIPGKYSKLFGLQDLNFQMMAIRINFNI